MGMGLIFKKLAGCWLGLEKSVLDRWMDDRFFSFLFRATLGYIMYKVCNGQTPSALFFGALRLLHSYSFNNPPSPPTFAGSVMQRFILQADR